MRHQIFILLLLFNTCSFFANASNLNPSDPKETSICAAAMAVSADTWLEGYTAGNSNVLVFFNTTEPEFEEYLNNTGIESMTINFIWVNEEDDSQILVQSNSISGIPNNTEIESWSSNLTIPQTEDGNLANGAFYFQIIINGTECGQLTLLPTSSEEVPEEEDEDLPINLPEYECGETFTPTNITNQDALTENVESGEVFFIRGFPILLEEVYNLGAGVFSGNGFVPLPFGGKMLKVQFTGVSVNTNYVIWQGSVVGIADDLANYPNFTVTSIENQALACPPPAPPSGYDEDGTNEVTGLDGWGFDTETGTHTNGTPYDNSGFDIDGIHEDTGTPYNDQGCDRDGLTIVGEACDPTGGAFPEATDFADSVEDELPTQINDIVNDLITSFTDSILTIDCNSLRNEVSDLSSGLGYAQTFIFGEDDIYLKKGMHQNFGQEPQKLGINIQRDPQAKELEEKHIELYHCDKKEHILEAFLSVLQDILTDDSGDLAEELLDKIKNWTEYQYNLYNDDPIAFEEWIQREIENIMEEESGLDDSYGLMEKQHKALNDPMEAMQKTIQEAFSMDRSNMITGATASKGTFAFDNQFTLEDASFLFRQGEQNINGVHRAFYLEELAKKQAATNNSDEVESLLPVSIERTVGNRTITMYLDAIVFTPNGATVDVYVVIEDPDTGKGIAFSAIGINFGPTGVTGESKLYLASDVGIRLNDVSQLILKESQETYVEWDCEGFVSMGIDAEIEFCRNVIVPLDPSTLEPKPEPETYKLSFKVQDITSWLELWIEIDAEPFAVAGNEHIKWELDQMKVDFSSTQTPQFNPVTGYTSPFYNGTMSPLWRGYHVKSISVTFPADFSEDVGSLTVGANDVLIDDTGFTGEIFVAQNFIEKDKGSLGGWAFSIDRFQLTILQNHLSGAGFDGEIRVPIFEEFMEYEASIYPGNKYAFTVTSGSNYEVDMFLATANLQSCSVGIEYTEDDGFTAEATMTGDFSINTENGDTDIDIQLPSVTFQDFKVSNKAPYLESGSWGISTSNPISVDLGGFGIALSGIQPHSTGSNDSAALGFNIDLKLSEDPGIEAGGKFSIQGGLGSDEQGRQKWSFSDLQIHGLSVDADFQGGEIKGDIEWFDGDLEWGKGFWGTLGAKVDGFDVDLTAFAQFGKKQSKKYFFIDATAELGSGIGTGVLQLKGFGGGLSKHIALSQENTITNGTAEGGGPGTSFSGTTYVFDPDKGYAFNAIGIIGTLDKYIFNGTVLMRGEFHNGGGLDNLTLKGSGQFLKPGELSPDFASNTGIAPPSAGAALSAYIDLTMNFGAPSFDGNIEVYLNAGPLTGSQTGGKMVDGSLYFGPNGWFIQMGTPSQRCGVTFGALGINAEVGTYFCIGDHNVPSMPALPSNVQEIAYLVNTNDSFRASGAGIVTGASIDLEMKASIAGIVSAQLSAGIGYDLMLRRYDGLSCQGSDDELGIDGWYGVGQMWAYAEGAIKVFGVNVASAGIAAVLQARLPNPFWAQGTAGVEVNLAFIKWKGSIKLVLGEECILDTSGGSPTAGLGMEIIAYIDPFNQMKGVDVTTQPTVGFNVEMDTPYEITDISGVQAMYEVSLKEHSLVDQSGSNILYDIVWNNDKTNLTVKPFNLLPGNDSLTLTIIVDIKKEGNDYAIEEKFVSFTTGQGYTTIPELNVEASYPINGMMNFYKDEYNAGNGFVKLKRGQIDLFANLPDNTRVKAKLLGTGGNESSSDVTYDAFEKKIGFALPGIVNGQMYELRIVHEIGDELDSNSGSTVGGEPSTATNGSGGRTAEKTLYSIYFRASDYNTFLDKMVATDAAGAGLEKPLAEDLDLIEMDGDGDKYDPLVQFTVNSNYWMNSEVDAVQSELGSYAIYCAGLDILYPHTSDVNGIIITGVTEVQGLSSETFNNLSTVNMSQGQALSFSLEDGIYALFELQRETINQCLSDNFSLYATECYGLDDGGSKPDGLRLDGGDVSEEWCTNFTYAQHRLNADGQGDINLDGMPSGIYTSTANYYVPTVENPTSQHTLTFEK